MLQLSLLKLFPLLCSAVLLWCAGCGFHPHCKINITESKKKKIRKWGITVCWIVLELDFKVR